MTSPKSTGGVGEHFESRVAAYYLSSLFLEAYTRGHPGAITKEVRLQRRYEGIPLDDVIVVGVDASGPVTLSLQVKRQLTFSLKKDDFKETLKQCWGTFSSGEFIKGRDRFGVAVGIYSSKIDNHYQTVLLWARESISSSDFLTRVMQHGVSNQSSRVFLETIRKGIAEINGSATSDDDLWAFLKHMVIIHFDFESGEGSRDYLSALERLRFSLPPGEQDNAQSIWLALVNKADKSKPAAGSVNIETLRAELCILFQLSPLASCVEDLRRIAVESDRALAEIDTSIGSVTLNRDDIIQEIDDLLLNYDFIEVIGDSGSGKSAILKMLAERLGINAPVLFLKYDRLAFEPGWSAQAKLWGLVNELPRILSELETSGQPILFIDGIDRIRNSTQWTIANDVLRAIYSSKSSIRWKVIVSARGNALHYIKQIAPEVLRDIKRKSVRVETLVADELDIIARAYPRLGPLIKQKGRAHNLAKKPFLLKRLIKWRETSASDDHPPATASDLLTLWWNNIDDQNDELLIKRQSLLRRLAEIRLSTPGGPIIVPAPDEQAVESLIADDTIRWDNLKEAASFVHDIYEDWAICLYLYQRLKEAPKLLKDKGEPLWLLDSFQLLGTFLLERTDTLDEWQSLINEVEKIKLQSHWSKSLLIAVLHSTRAHTLLTRLETNLLFNEGKLLHDLLTAVQTTEVYPNTIFLDPKAAEEFSESERVQAAYEYAQPRLTWVPLLQWLTPKLNSLPPTLYWKLSLIFESWQRTYGNQKIYFSNDIIAFCLEWLRILEKSRHFEKNDASERVALLGIPYRDEDKLEERLRSIVITSPNDSPELVSGYLKDVISNDRRGEARGQMLKKSISMGQYIPKDLVDFMLSIMCEFPPEGERFGHMTMGPFDFNDLGIMEEWSYYPSSQMQPPFLTLLSNHPDEGIRLINGLCNHAMEVWHWHHSHEKRGTPIPVHIQFTWGERKFWGGAREYCWYRGTQVGPNAVVSALMALEVWMEERVKAGDDIEELFKKVLGGNESVAVLGVCVSTALANPDKSLKAALPFITCPFLWWWDIQRLTMELGSTPSNTYADWARYRHLLEPIHVRNQLSYRKVDIRSLAPFYVLGNDDVLRETFIEQISGFPGNLPFEYEEDREDKAYSNELKERMSNFALAANRENYELQRMEDGEQIAIIFKAPAELEEKTKALEEKNKEIGHYMKLALWADKAFETGLLGDDVALIDALQEAIELDEATLFETAPDSSDLFSFRKGAVSGAASVIARFENELDEETITWLRDVFHRASAMPILDRHSVRMADPVRNAVRGLSAFIAKGIATGDDREILLSLVGSPSYEICVSIFQEVRHSGQTDPHFCWELFVAGLKLCIKPRSALPMGEGEEYQELEATWVAENLDFVWEEYQKGIWSDLPEIPMPWILAPENKKEEGDRYDGYVESDIHFMWGLAGKIMFSAPLDIFISNENTREQVLSLVHNLVLWSIEDACPPWKDGHGHSGRAIEWGFKFFEKCGLISKHLGNEEIYELVLNEVQKVESDIGLQFMAYFMGGVVKERFSQDTPPSDATIILWEDIVTWLVEHPDWEWTQSRDFIMSEYFDCISIAIFTRYGYSYFQSPWPGLEKVGPLVKKWAETFGKHPETFHLLISFLEKTAWELLPAPALGWLDNILQETQDQKVFWDKHENGQKVAGLLYRGLQEKGGEIATKDEYLNQMTRMANILVNNGIRLAAQIQQEIARLMKSEN